MDYSLKYVDHNVSLKVQMCSNVGVIASSMMAIKAAILKKLSLESQ